MLVDAMDVRVRLRILIDRGRKTASPGRRTLTHGALLLDYLLRQVLLVVGQVILLLRLDIEGFILVDDAALPGACC